jgi:hypothetical protein
MSQLIWNTTRSERGDQKPDPFATVAMVYDPTIKDATDASLPESYVVQFQVYDGNGQSLNQAKLDSKKNNTASNISVPINRLVCHGGEFDNTTKLANVAHFLPFDVSRLKFADDVGIDNGNPAYTHNMQAHNMHHLNEYVYLSGVTQDIKKMIDNRHFQYL